MNVQPLQFGDGGQVATRELLARFAAACRDDPRLEALRDSFDLFAALDRQYGGSGPIGLEETAAMVDTVITELTRDEAEPELVIGVALWAIRHALEIGAIEPVANALAQRANAARSPSESAAVFGLMQGVIANATPRLVADLEQSNPERPWRILHVNLVITAIRTEDERMMDFAFDALDAALPGECAGFYAEAMALALAPGIAPQVRERIGQRHIKWTALP
jgi:hypothetical protein